jgi:transcriptional regulator with XRE-family HTH domain
MVDQLRTWRTQRLLTQAEVAKAVGVATQTYAAWVRGERVPRLTHMRALARVLRVSPAALLAAFNDRQTDEGKALAA